ncbi:MAG: cytochrome C oxidase subunit IV family protein [Terriglobia bacterium]
MSANTVQGHAATGPRTYLWVWFGLLLLTSVEVYLAYIHLPVNLMLILLMGLSVIKAGLIMAYFMHLRFERFSLFLTLVPALVLCICLLLIFFFPDSLRLHELSPPVG